MLRSDIVDGLMSFILISQDSAVAHPYVSMRMYITLYSRPRAIVAIQRRTCLDCTVMISIGHGNTASRHHPHQKRTPYYIFFFLNKCCKLVINIIKNTSPRINHRDRLLGLYPNPSAWRVNFTRSAPRLGVGRLGKLRASGDTSTICLKISTPPFSVPGRLNPSSV